MNAYLILGMLLSMFGALCVVVGAVDRNKTIIVCGAILVASGSYLIGAGDTVLML